MVPVTVKADRQKTSLLIYMLWSNVVVILAIIGLNLFNLARANSGDTLVSVAEPQLVLLVSFAMILYLGYGCFTALATKRRLDQVFLSLDDKGVSGFSLPHPMTAEAGEVFSLSYREIISVSIEEVAFTKKHTAYAIKLETAERSYLVPAPERIKEIVSSIAERMTEPS